MTSKSKTSATDDMTAWEMALSVLVGLRKTEAKALEEYRTLQAANPRNPFARGMTGAYNLAQTIGEARYVFEYELRRIAGSSNRTIPEREKDAKNGRL